MRLYIVLFCFLCFQVLPAQSKQLPVQLDYKHKKADWVLSQLERQFLVKFSYPTDLLKDKTVSLQGGYENLGAVLSDLSLLLGIDFQ